MHDLRGVTPCAFSRDGDFWACALCGRRVRARSESPPAAVCGRPKRGLGDIVAAGLTAAGITKERVSAVVGRDCGCAKRQEALNEWGRKYLGIGVDTTATVAGERDADAPEAHQAKGDAAV